MTSPAHAISATSFVPDGYYIEHRAAVDIDHDGLTDHVYVARRQERPFLDTTRDRRILVIRALPNHSNILIAQGRRAALCTGCGGAVYARRVAPVTLTHGARTFTIAQRWGTSRIKTQRLTFGFRDRHVSLVKIDQTGRRSADEHRHADRDRSRDRRDPQDQDGPRRRRRGHPRVRVLSHAPAASRRLHGAHVVRTPALGPPVGEKP